MNIPYQILTVARSLGELNDRVVFVGGMMRSLLITDPAFNNARVTEDVDLIVDVLSAADYRALEAELRTRGFREHIEQGAPLCRWNIAGTRVDIMPVDPIVLGFSNVWYATAHASALTIREGEVTLRILDAPHFCATKLEAFASRGEGDVHHHDLEDFIAVVDGRATLVHELSQAPKNLRDFISDETGSLLALDAFREALPGHLPPDDASQARVSLILSRLQSIARLKSPPKASIGLHSRSQTPRAWIPLATPVAGSGEYRFTRSTNLSRAWYDNASRTLTIEFQSGSRYEYFSVPPEIYRGLTLAASAGQYLNQWIKDRFNYRKIR